VLLTNSDRGGSLLGPLMRRLLEVVYDAKPEAGASVDAAATNYRTIIAKERARLTFPATAEEASKLATHYVNAELGNINVKRSGEQTVFVWDGGESRMAMRKNDDGTISFINADPPLSGFEFVRSEKDGKRAPHRSRCPTRIFICRSELASYEHIALGSLRGNLTGTETAG